MPKSLQSRMTFAFGADAAKTNSLLRSMGRCAFHGIAQPYMCHRCPVLSVSPMSCTIPRGPLTLTLSPLRGATANSCVDPHVAIDPGARRLIDLVRVFVGIVSHNPRPWGGESGGIEEGLDGG